VAGADVQTRTPSPHPTMPHPQQKTRNAAKHSPAAARPTYSTYPKPYPVKKLHSKETPSALHLHRAGADVQTRTPSPHPTMPHPQQKGDAAKHSITTVKTMCSTYPKPYPVKKLHSKGLPSAWHLRAGADVQTRTPSQHPTMPHPQHKGDAAKHSPTAARPMCSTYQKPYPVKKLHSKGLPSAWHQAVAVVGATPAHPYPMSTAVMQIMIQTPPILVDHPASGMVRHVLSNLLHHPGLIFKNTATNAATSTVSQTVPPNPVIGPEAHA